MKKMVVKYLPIAIALVLVGACILSVNIYNGSFAEYAVFSYSSDTYSFDMKISASGRVITLDAVNRESYEIKDTVSAVVGKDIADAASFLEETLKDDIAMVTVMGAEKNEIPEEKLRELAYRAADALNGSHIVSYGNYTESDANRVNAFEISLGRIAAVTSFANYCTDNIPGCYIDSYSASPADLESLAYYVNYVKNEVIAEDLRNGIMIDPSRVTFKASYITPDTAKELIDEGSETWYGELVDDFTYNGISFSNGHLRYKFTTFFYGYESYVYVNMTDGLVQFDDEG